MAKYKPVVLIILDGFGISPDKIGSPWEAADHPVFSEIEKYYPFTTLQASGIAVGLPWGEAGNSEVGHLTIGSGKIIYNYLPRISLSINDKSFFQNAAFLEAINHVKQNNSALHISGLFSSGTVHAYYEHMHALLEMTKQNQVKNVYLHLFTDGKDAYKKEAVGFYKEFEKYLQQNYPDIKIASIIGRKFPMDRDKNWDRIEKAYDLFTKGEGTPFQSASSYIENYYQQGIFDEAIPPGFDEKEKELSRIKDNDALIFSNFREDSMRQITHSFADEKFEDFPRTKINNLKIVTMTEYEKNLPCAVAFKSAEVEWPIARILAKNGLTQLHIAESEKYAHITYFFNGGRETPFNGEERVLVPSPDVSSYDQVPAMSSEEVTQAISENLTKYDFMAINYANADMVGHTGKFEATAKACEALDVCVGKILDKILQMNGLIIITSDHGNAEEKLYKMTGEEKTKHSINPVPFYVIGNDFKRKEPLTPEEIGGEYKKVKGTLTDIAPTILELMDLSKPESMTGKSLLNDLKK